MKTEIAGFLVFGAIAAAGAARPQPPSVDVRMEALGPGTRLDAVVQRAAAASEAVWLGWSVPAVPGSGDSCCFQGRFADWGRRGCRLEGGKGGINSFGGDESRPRPATDLVVLVRFARGGPTEIRPVGLDCPLDFGGRVFWWLGPTGGEESAALLAGWVQKGQVDVDESDALLALSMQQHGVDHLIRLARDRTLARDLRREAVFWLGQSEDERAMEFLEATLLRPASR